MKKWLLALSYSFGSIIGISQTVELTPLKDNTIFSENNNASSGAGTDIYIGRTGTNANNSIRRALLQFKLDTIPANAIINSVTLSINCTKASPYATGPNIIGFHVARQSWGEGASVGPAGQGTTAMVGDATWACRFSNGAGGCTQSWTTNGADFNGTPSATVSVDATGAYVVASNAALIADIKRWVDTPSVNFGWVLKGDEINSNSTRALSSKENVLKGCKLTVSYSLPACSSNTWTGAINNAWETAGNWSCNVVPDNSMNVIVNGGTIAVNSNTTVKTLQLHNGANLIVKTGVTLIVLQ